jgi:hypothetical protein
MQSLFDRLWAVGQTVLEADLRRLHDSLKQQRGDNLKDEKLNEKIKEVEDKLKSLNAQRLQLSDSEQLEAETPSYWFGVSELEEDETYQDLLKKLPGQELLNYQFREPSNKTGVDAYNFLKALNELRQELKKDPSIVWFITGITKTIVVGPNLLFAIAIDKTGNVTFFDRMPTYVPEVTLFVGQELSDIDKSLVDVESRKVATWNADKTELVMAQPLALVHFLGVDAFKKRTLLRVKRRTAMDDVHLDLGEERVIEAPVAGGKWSTLAEKDDGTTSAGTTLKFVATKGDQTFYYRLAGGKYITLKVLLRYRCRRCQGTYLRTENRHGSCVWHPVHPARYKREYEAKLVKLARPFPNKSIAALLKERPDELVATIQRKLLYIQTRYGHLESAFSRVDKKTGFIIRLDEMPLPDVNVIIERLAQNRAVSGEAYELYRIAKRMFTIESIETSLNPVHFDSEDPALYPQSVESRNPNYHFGLCLQEGKRVWQCCGLPAGSEQKGCLVGYHSNKTDEPNMTHVAYAKKGEERRATEYINEPDTFADLYGQIIKAKERGDLQTALELEQTQNYMAGGVLSPVLNNASAEDIDHLRFDLLGGSQFNGLSINEFFTDMIAKNPAMKLQPPESNVWYMSVEKARLYHRGFNEEYTVGGNYIRRLRLLESLIQKLDADTSAAARGTTLDEFLQRNFPGAIVFNAQERTIIGTAKLIFETTDNAFLNVNAVEERLAKIQTTYPFLQELRNQKFLTPESKTLTIEFWATLELVIPTIKGVLPTANLPKFETWKKDFDTFRSSKIFKTPQDLVDITTWDKAHPIPTSTLQTTQTPTIGDQSAFLDLVDGEITAASNLLSPAYEAYNAEWKDLQAQRQRLADHLKAKIAEFSTKTFDEKQLKLTGTQFDTLSDFLKKFYMQKLGADEFIPTYIKPIFERKENQFEPEKLKDAYATDHTAEFTTTMTAGDFSDAEKGMSDINQLFLGFDPTNEIEKVRLLLVGVQPTWEKLNDDIDVAAIASVSKLDIAPLALDILSARIKKAGPSGATQMVTDIEKEINDMTALAATRRQELVTAQESVERARLVATLKQEMEDKKNAVITARTERNLVTATTASVQDLNDAVTVFETQLDPSTPLVDLRTLSANAKRFGDFDNLLVIYQGEVQKVEQEMSTAHGQLFSLVGLRGQEVSAKQLKLASTPISQNKQDWANLHGDLLSEAASLETQQQTDDQEFNDERVKISATSEELRKQASKGALPTEIATKYWNRFTDEINRYDFVAFLRAKKNNNLLSGRFSLVGFTQLLDAAAAEQFEQSEAEKAARERRLKQAEEEREAEENERRRQQALDEEKRIAARKESTQQKEAVEAQLSAYKVTLTIYERFFDPANAPTVTTSEDFIQMAASLKAATEKMLQEIQDFASSSSDLGRLRSQYNAITLDEKLKTALSSDDASNLLGALLSLDKREDQVEFLLFFVLARKINSLENIESPSQGNYLYLKKEIQRPTYLSWSSISGTNDYPLRQAIADVIDEGENNETLQSLKRAKEAANSRLMLATVRPPPTKSTMKIALMAEGGLTRLPPGDIQTNLATLGEKLKTQFPGLNLEPTVFTKSNWRLGLAKKDIADLQQNYTHLVVFDDQAFDVATAAQRSAVEALEAVKDDIDIVTIVISKDFAKFVTPSKSIEKWLLDVPKNKEPKSSTTSSSTEIDIVEEPKLPETRGRQPTGTPSTKTRESTPGPSKLPPGPPSAPPKAGPPVVVTTAGAFDPVPFGFPSDLLIRLKTPDVANRAYSAVVPLWNAILARTDIGKSTNYRQSPFSSTQTQKDAEILCHKRCFALAQAWYRLLFACWDSPTVRSPDVVEKVVALSKRIVESNAEPTLNSLFGVLTNAPALVNELETTKIHILGLNPTTRKEYPLLNDYHNGFADIQKIQQIPLAMLKDFVPVSDALIPNVIPSVDLPFWIWQPPLFFGYLLLHKLMGPARIQSDFWQATSWTESTLTKMDATTFEDAVVELQRPSVVDYIMANKPMKVGETEKESKEYLLRQLGPTTEELKQFISEKYASNVISKISNFKNKLVSEEKGSGDKKKWMFSNADDVTAVDTAIASGWAKKYLPLVSNDKERLRTRIARIAALGQTRFNNSALDQVWFVSDTSTPSSEFLELSANLIGQALSYSKKWIDGELAKFIKTNVSSAFFKSDEFQSRKGDILYQIINKNNVNVDVFQGFAFGSHNPEVLLNGPFNANHSHHYELREIGAAKGMGMFLYMRFVLDSLLFANGENFLLWLEPKRKLNAALVNDGTEYEVFLGVSAALLNTYQNWGFRRGFDVERSIRTTDRSPKDLLGWNIDVNILSKAATSHYAKIWISGRKPKITNDGKNFTLISKEVNKETRVEAVSFPTPFVGKNPLSILGLGEAFPFNKTTTPFDRKVISKEEFDRDLIFVTWKNSTEGKQWLAKYMPKKGQTPDIDGDALKYWQRETVEGRAWTTQFQALWNREQGDKDYVSSLPPEVKGDEDTYFARTQVYRFYCPITPTKTTDGRFFDISSIPVLDPKDFTEKVSPMTGVSELENFIYKFTVDPAVLQKLLKQKYNSSLELKESIVDAHLQATFDFLTNLLHAQ